MFEIVSELRDIDFEPLGIEIIFVKFMHFGIRCCLFLAWIVIECVIQLVSFDK